MPSTYGDGGNNNDSGIGPSEPGDYNDPVSEAVVRGWIIVVVLAVLVGGGFLVKSMLHGGSSSDSSPSAPSTSANAQVATCDIFTVADLREVLPGASSANVSASPSADMCTYVISLENTASITAKLSCGSLSDDPLSQYGRADKPLPYSVAGARYTVTDSTDGPMYRAAVRASEGGIVEVDLGWRSASEYAVESLLSKAYYNMKTRGLCLSG